jgi:D-arabinose 5-phosphate isomerase GutQ
MKITSELVNDDWERIYLNDVLVFESHSVTARQLMDVLSAYEDIQCKLIEVTEEE